MSCSDPSSERTLRISDLNLKPGPTFTIHDLIVGFEAQELQDKGLNKMEILMTLLRDGVLEMPKGLKFVKKENLFKVGAKDEVRDMPEGN